MIQIGLYNPFLSPDELYKILDFYNSNIKYLKNIDNNNLQLLLFDNIHYGFKILLNNPIQCSNIKNDPNNLIRQLRFNNKLLYHFNFNDFTFEQKILLYRSLNYVLGNDAVFIQGLNEWDKISLNYEIHNDKSYKI